MGGAMVQRTVKFRQRGATGNGIKSVSRTYAISAQGTTVNDTAAPAIYGTWSSSSPAVTEAYPYLWAKEIVVYTDDSSTTRYYCVGGRGANGVDAQDIEWVYVRTTENVQPVIVAESGNGYLSDDYKPLAKVTSGRIKGGSEGNANVNVRCTDDPQGVDSTWKYEWEIKREKGTADANGHRAWVAYSGSMTLHNRYVKDITSANVWYALADSGTTKPGDSSFTLDAFPTTLNAGKYVWEATKVTYSDGTSEFTAKMCLGPTTDFLSGTEVYAISTSNSTAPAENTTNWKTTYEKTKGYYLWTATRVQYTSGTYAYLNKKCVGYWGEDGRHAPYDIVTYGISKSQTSCSTSNLYHQVSGDSGWYSTAPSTTSTYPYVWEKIEHYTWNGGTATLSSTSYVCLTGEKGPDGKSLYGLSSSASLITLSKNYAGVISASLSSYTISLQYGGNSITSIPSGYSLWQRKDGGSWTSATLGSKTTLASDNFNDGAVGVIEYAFCVGTSYVAGNVLSSASVSVRWEIQRMLIPQGKWDEATNYQFARTDTTTPLVFLDGNNGGTYWYLIADNNNAGTSSSPSWVAPGTNGSIWAQATNYEVILTKMIFAEMARLGSYVVYDRFFFSQYGTLIYKGASGNTLETTVKASNVSSNFNGITPIVLNGNETNDIIVCKVAFYATANAQIKITLTPSSEANYDFGAIGVLGTESSPGNSRWLESADQSTIKNTAVGTYMLKKASGITPVDTTITIPSTGEYFIEIAYACDVDVANDDTATFVFEKKSGIVTWRSLSKVAGSQWMTFTGKAGNFVPYAWFDPSDPMAENVPATGYKFRPAKCINALAGEEWMAGGNVHVSQAGDITMQNAVIEGSLMYHKTYVDKAGNSITPFTMWSVTGSAVDVDGSATVKKVTMQYDTIIIGGNTRSNSYNLFTNIVATGYTVLLPPAKFFPGMRLKIINGTFTGGNGNAATLSPSPINLAVIYRSDTEELVDYIDSSYDANMIAAALPVTFNNSNGNDFTFVGAPDSTKHIDYTPTTANRFTVFGLKGSSNKKYKSIELAALENPYVSGTHYCWMIIDVQE